MNKGRLEAFSDGVIAVIITIMVLELKVPHGADAGALVPLVPVFLSYVLSFVFVGIFVTGWMNENHFAAVTVAAYGMVLLCAALAFTILTLVLKSNHPRDSILARALGKDSKGNVSLVLYLAAIPLAFVSAWIAGALYVTVAAIWLLPDRRFEKLLTENRTASPKGGS